VERERARELLSDYLEGELSCADQQAIEGLLKRDEALRAEMHELRRTLDALGSLRPVAPSDDFLQQVRQKIRRRDKSPFDIAFGLDRKIPFEAISMVLIGILLALYLLLVVMPRERLDEHAAEPPRRIRPDAGICDGGQSPGAGTLGEGRSEAPARLGPHPRLRPRAPLRTHPRPGQRRGGP
jgi:hypothetical protein